MPLPKTGKRTDQQRQSQKEYDLTHFKVAACKISIAKYEQFQAYAKSHRKTVSGLLAAFIDDCISGADPGTDPGQPEK